MSVSVTLAALALQIFSIAAGVISVCLHAQTHTVANGAICPLHHSGAGEEDTDLPRMTCRCSSDLWSLLAGEVGVLSNGPQTTIDAAVHPVIPVRAAPAFEIATRPLAPPPRFSLA